MICYVNNVTKFIILYVITITLQVCNIDNKTAISSKQHSEKKEYCINEKVYE